MCILMRNGGKFSTTLLAKGGGRLGAPHKRNLDPLESGHGLRGAPRMDQTLIQINTKRIRAKTLQCSRLVMLRVRES
jgi:hypothetical protein